MSATVQAAVRILTYLKEAQKTYLVGLDGSELSLRAVQIAAQVMDQMKDNLVIITLGREDNPKDYEIFARNESKAKEVAMKNGVPHFRIVSEFVKIKGDLFQGLKSLANAHANGSSILVIGAAGKGEEDREAKRPDGQPPMGSIAQRCLEHCKVPVLLVKAGPKLDLDVMRVKRAGRDKTPGLNIAVCMDTTLVSQRAFDVGCKMLKKGDSLLVLHVSDDEESSTPLVQELTLSCDKLLSGGKCAKAEVCCELRGNKKQSVRHYIEAFVEDRSIDVLVMGSVELSKVGGKTLGSVSSAITKVSPAHCCVVKNFALTG